MNDLFHKILAHLYSINALHQETDITDFLKQTLGQDYNNPSLLQNVRTALGQLGVGGYIARDHQPILGQPGNGSETNNLDEHKIRVKLELLGHTYIEDKIRKANQDALLLKQTTVAEKTGDSVIDTNAFSKKIAGKNMIILWLTLIVAAAGAFATIKSCQIASQQNKQQKLIEQQDQSILTLKNKLTEKDVTLSVQKKTIDSLLKTKDGAKQKDTNIVTLTK